ncbi:hypothetical protein niasHT_018282 [Heterodera trifolii]|uniref:BTB domain-containing protein n=1 Tax=Heterodera trifolii TaxID=157864 RepID=A0ABD2L9D1_9BILA
MNRKKIENLQKCCKRKFLDNNDSENETLSADHREQNENNNDRDDDFEEHAILLFVHKLILKHASDVLEAMLRFDSHKERTENASAVNPVEVPDVEPAAFKVMLSFIYSDDLRELKGDSAMEVLSEA